MNQYWKQQHLLGRYSIVPFQTHDGRLVGLLLAGRRYLPLRSSRGLNWELRRDAAVGGKALFRGVFDVDLLKKRSWDRAFSRSNKGLSILAIEDHRGLVMYRWISSAQRISLETCQRSNPISSQRKVERFNTQFRAQDYLPRNNALCNNGVKKTARNCKETAFKHSPREL